MPLSGRQVPELNSPDLREVIHQNYRIVYHVQKGTDAVEILAVIHEARDFRVSWVGWVDWVGPWVGTWSSLAVDGGGNVHVAWCDDTDYAGSGTDPDIFYNVSPRTPIVPILIFIIPGASTTGVIDVAWLPAEGAFGYFVYRAEPPPCRARLGSGRANPNSHSPVALIVHGIEEEMQYLKNYGRPQCKRNLYRESSFHAS
ncbi:MAG: type II toxin-antitoxin system RelE/ParE family toxin [Candidatus Lokiarchaeota archaeon]|nr:type II toxin-antitoxin system RelE/ParE family toxin [Candidatus Lokiarchaeota archaeon]